MKKIIFFTILFCAPMSQVNGQKIVLKNDLFSKALLPKSIYTVAFFNNDDAHSFSTINKRLDIAAVKFSFLDEDLYYSNYFTLSTKAINEKTSTFLVNDYQNFSDTYFKKQFLQKIDATKWSFEHFVYKQ